ncbi:MAG: heme-degrading domain-containing protein [Rhizobiales bacterium]|nr:heme-degrading domain-containing protein [Hyphomicrobiales bacterium]
MSIASDIEQIKRQEESLRFTGFDEASAWSLGNAMRESAVARKLPFVIDIRTGIRPLFYCALPGSTAENADWARRKVNTVYRFEAASYRVGLEHKSSGKVFDQTRGITPLDFAPAGGGFPIRIGPVVIGCVTVSGVPQRDDHNFVVECLAGFLKVPYAGIALPPETA